MRDLKVPKPKVSVVIVFLNGEDFIGEAIASVQAQTLEDWELILVNDGSVDASTDIAMAAAEGSNVRYLEHSGRVNLGVAAGRELGAGKAGGEYLLYLDHDDILYPDCLASMAHILDGNPRVGAVFATTRFWAYDPALGLTDSIQSFEPLPDGMTNGRAFLRRLLKSEDMHPAVCSTMHRLSALQAAYGAGPMLSGMYEDTAVLARVLAAGDVYILNRTVSDYRIHGSSMCKQATAAGTHGETTESADRLRFLKWLRNGVALDVQTRLMLERAIIAHEQPGWYAAIRGLARRIARTRHSEIGRRHSVRAGS